MRTLIVSGTPNFKINIPDDAKVTFGPWSPPNAKGYQGQTSGTLRIYQGMQNIIGCFSGVTGFRETTMEYIEEVLVEKGSTIWQDDKGGYIRESRVEQKRDWVGPDKQLEEDVFKDVVKPKKGRKL